MGFLDLRKSGFEGPVDQDGNAVMSRTDGKGKPLELFKGGSGTGTPDDKNSPKAGPLARGSRKR
jgi:hypothetical protein